MLDRDITKTEMQVAPKSQGQRFFAELKRFFNCLDISIMRIEMKLQRDALSKLILQS
jgi:hypothetical protein